MNLLIEAGKCYRIAGRSPIIVTSVTYFSNSKRITVRGYTINRYKEFMKFHTIDPKTYKSQAEIEGIEPPQITEFRFNTSSKIEKIDVRKVAPNSPYVLNDLQALETGEIDYKLSLPRKELHL